MCRSSSLKTTSKRTIQKTAKATDDLIGHKVVDAVAWNTSQKSSRESKTSMQTKNADEIPRKTYIAPEKRQQIIDKLRLI